MKVTLYHNPQCGTSRKVLELLRARGIEPEIIDYLKTSPDKPQFEALLSQLKIPARGLLRTKEKRYGELGLDDPALSDQALLEALARNPVLLNRPVVVTGMGAKIARPAEAVLEILPDRAQTDGEERHE